MSLNELTDQPTVSTVTTVSPICPRGCEKKEKIGIKELTKWRRIGERERERRLEFKE